MSTGAGQAGSPASADNRKGACVTVNHVFMEYETITGRVRALSDISLLVEPGNSMAIVGPSGSGKSTLLGILGGLELPTSGEVHIGEHLVSSMSEVERTLLRRQSIGFVFQSDNLQPFLTVSENVGLQSVLAGIADDPVRTQELLDALEITSLAHRFPDQLSGGQRQRVAVARALITRPILILADEPTGSLDAESSTGVVELMLRLKELSSTTLVIATHDRAVAERMDVVMEMQF